MLFNSLNFLVFFIIVYALYLVLPPRKQNVMLLIASYFFYGCWDWRFLTLIWFSTAVDYWVGNCIARAETTAQKRRFLLISLISDLSILGFFKYFNFFADSAYALLSALGLPIAPWHLRIILPVGISFYTFQALSYTIDIYRGQLAPARSLFNFALYVAFFPQLVAGPIERATHLLPQMEKPRVVTWAGIRAGTWLILWGLFKKVVIADNLADIVDPVFNGAVPLTGVSVLLALYAFAFQIYCDFSGYSDMARGLARYMGVEIMVNFNNPYFALNPSEFWRRWHISLSTWLRDYLYIPLGGNRKGPVRTYINLGLTMLLGGLWHGAAWNFVVWGAYQGALLIVHRLFSSLPLVLANRTRTPIRTGAEDSSTSRSTNHEYEGKASPTPGLQGAGRGEAVYRALSKLLRIVIMFHAACIGWLLFRAHSLDQIGQMLKALGHGWSFDVRLGSWAIALIILCLPLWLVQILQERTRDLEAPMKLSLVPRLALVSVVLVMLFCLGNNGGAAFIYFQF